MKRILALILLATIVLILPGCGNDESNMSYLDKQRLGWDAQIKWYKECADKYDFLINKIPEDAAPETISNYPIPIGEEIIYTDLTYSRTECIANLYVHDYYTAADDRIFDVAIDRNTGICAEVQYNDAVKVDQTEQQYKAYIKTAYECYDHLRTTKVDIDWSKYTLQILSYRRNTYVTYRKYLPSNEISLNNYINHSYPTADCAYINCLEKDGNLYLAKIRFYDLGNFPNTIAAVATRFEYTISIDDLAKVLEVPVECVALNDNLSFELIYINGRFCVRWSGYSTFAYVPISNAAFLDKSGRAWESND